ncbi:MAG: T9SS type A sorting domain-containing protein [Flavobacteriales bacterium]|nr:T9SS type A sorting domain-containing protein [Flavobacteriales bacterium]
MNQRYFLLPALLVAGGAMAQWANSVPARKDFRAATPSRDHIQSIPAQENDSRDGGDVIWSEDFANGLDGNNGVGAWTVSGPNGAIWRRKTTGPLGAYTGVTQIIQSTTAANGFMMFNSDSANCTWVGNTPTALPTDQFTAWEGSLESPVLDLSATPYVELQFQQRLRYCCDNAPHYVEVSTDGGATWPNRFAVSADIAVNAVSPTQTRKVNLSCAIEGNPSSVKIRFRHDGDMGTSHYQWQVDDVKIVELYDADLRVVSASASAFDLDLAATYDSLRYSLFPFNQLRPVPLNMTVLNNSTIPQDGTVANFTVTRSGTTVLNQDQSLGTFPLCPAEQKVWVNPSFTPPAEVGTYDVAFAISATNPDLTPADNTGSASFGVSQYDYARDLGTITSFEDGAGDGSVLILGNTFYIANATNLYAARVALNTGSEIGAIITAELRDVSQADFPIIATSEEVVVAQSMLGGNGSSNFTNINFNPPVALDAQMDYMLTVHCYGNIRIGNNGNSEEQTSFIYYISPTQGEDWFYTTTTPMVRMSFDPTASVGDFTSSAGVGLGQNIPNPSRNSTVIPYTLDKGASVVIELHDVSGKLVKRIAEGFRPAGSYRSQLSTQDLTEGLYLYTLRAGDVTLTKRLSVER